MQKEIEQETGVKFGTLDIENFIHIEVPVEVAVHLGLPVPEEVLSNTHEAADAELSDNTPAEQPISFVDFGLANEPALPMFTPVAEPKPTVKLGYEGAQRVIETLADQGVITKQGKITAAGREKIEQGQLALPEAYQPIANPIIEEIRRANTRIVVRDHSKEIVVRQKKEVFLSDAFKEIWERIRQKTLYRVKMDRERFVEYAAVRLSLMPPIQRTRIVQTTASVNIKRSGVEAVETNYRAIAVEHDPLPIPDLLTILRSELHLRRATLLDILKRSGRMGDYLMNPGRFMEEAPVILRDCKAEMIVDGIRYKRIAGAEYSVAEIFDKDELIGHLDRDAIPVNRSVYDHIIVDSMGVERRFAQALDADDDVKMFFKLPDNFKIDTPLGTYNPDWAVLLNMDGAEKLYFVLETKGTTRELGRRMDENIKTECGRRHFAALGTVDYEVTADWKSVKLGAM